MIFARPLLLLSLPILAFGAKRQVSSDTFELFAYGEGLGGLALFNSGGKLAISKWSGALTLYRICLCWKSAVFEQF